MTPHSPPPETLDAGEITLRRWRTSDAPALAAAVTASLEHLRPWMPWIAEEPVSPQARRALIAQWLREWETGDTYNYGLFAGRAVVGSAGLHRRVGPGGLEIGYWVHVDHTGRGYATSAAGALAETALALPGVTFVEIHHDKANVASGRVPAKLGFHKVDEQADAITAPGECGISCRWRLVAGAGAARQLTHDRIVPPRSVPDQSVPDQSVHTVPGRGNVPPTR